MPRRNEASRLSDDALRDKVCVVTGASRGIGRAVALELAARGADLLLCARGVDGLERAAAEIAERFPVTVHVAAADLSEDDAGDAVSAAIGTHFGRVNGLVNNAGQLGPVGLIDEVDPVAWASALLANVAGTVRLIGALVPVFAASGGGSIVNLSGAGMGGPSVPSRVSAYTASKAAIVSLSETLAAELHDRGVRVNAIAPGAVATRFLQPVLEAGAQRAGDELYRAAASGDAPSAPSRQFLEWLSYLLSDESGWLTGRLVSARWDDLEKLASHAQLDGGSLYTMRRIDDVLYRAVTTLSGPSST